MSFKETLSVFALDRVSFETVYFYDNFQIVKGNLFDGLLPYSCITYKAGGIYNVKLYKFLHIGSTLYHINVTH